MKMQQARLPSIIRDVVGGAPGDDPGCCGVPPEVPRAVTAARLCIVLSIVIHAISLFVEGWFWDWQRNAAFGVFAVGGLVLCIYDQYMYAIGGIGFAACAVFDIFAVVRWTTGDDEIFQDSDDDRWYAFEESSDDDSNALWYALPPFLGAITMGLGAIFSFTAVFFWEDGDGTAVPHVAAPPQPPGDSTKQPQSQQESKTAELGLAPPSAYPRTPPPAYHPQSPPPAYRPKSPPPAYRR